MLYTLSYVIIIIILHMRYVLINIVTGPYIVGFISVRPKSEEVQNIPEIKGTQ